MKQNTAVNSLLRTQYGVEARARLIAEFNHNRYSTLKIDNTIPEEDEGYDRDAFPIESIALPMRPSRQGIVRNQAGWGKVTNETGSMPVLPRYITSSENDSYKYWLGPMASDSAGNIPVVNGRLSWAPYIQYTGGVKANKIRAQFESTMAAPTAYSVQVQGVANGAWVTIYTGTSAPANGRLELYRSGSSWTTTPTRDPAVTVHGVRVLVTKLNRGNAYLGMIELAVLLEMDLTPPRERE